MGQKMPRDLSGSDLVKALKRLDFLVTRQVGSHIRLTTKKNGEFHITIPNHNPIKLGTLNGILSDISLHFNMSKQELIDTIF